MTLENRQNLPASNSFQECTHLINPEKSSKRHLRRHSYDDSESSMGQTSRRQLRYCRAEHALLISFHSHLDTSPSDNTTNDSLQIQLRLLHQATAFLTTQAADARERLDALSNGVLKRSDVQPEKHRQALIERWKEQRSLEKIENEVKQAEAVIANMNANRSIATVANQNPESRAQKNLIRFLHTSSLRPNARRLRPRPRSTILLVDRTPRRMTLADVTPIRARPWSITEALIREHAQLKNATPVTLIPAPHTKISTSPPGLQIHGKKQTMALSSSLGSISEVSSMFVALRNQADGGLEGDSTPSSAFTSVFSHSEDTESVSEIDTPVPAIGDSGNEATSPCPSNTPLLPSRLDMPPTRATTTYTNGTATIYPHTHHHSNFDNIEIEVEIPIYALELFAGFDRVGSDFGMDRALDLPSSTTTTLSAPETPNQIPKRSKHIALPSVFLTPPRRSPRSSGSLEGRAPNLKPSVSLGSLQPASHSQLRPERERASLLSIAESSSMLSLSSSRNSLAPSRFGNGIFVKEEHTFPLPTVLSPPLEIRSDAPANVTLNEDSSNSNHTQSSPSSKVTRLKRKLSSRLSLTVFGSPTKTLKKELHHRG
ncbi:hypothetical protein EV359DRAFT_81816 [Lentinula novae-zelandiae]|uniref:Shugoshin C-terminal domain-containing protein n=1 Tax=Lentinula lateritia TaxID=40482 RepID=A0ABQ8VE15_9AGAR|nr:hypothetical protein EV359DRAFT_81816 [Lentinula novae-zelandiae]KAJ4489866.1 hypothetical protein C8R41DRAFT_920565 [Lentinula lateritia]